MTKTRRRHINIVFISLIVLLLIGLYRYTTSEEPVEKVKKEESVLSSPTPIHSNTLTESLFVPYWALQQDDQIKEYDELYYFGVAPTKDGEIENEQGNKGVELLDNLRNEKTTLVVRLMDEHVIESLLESKTRQLKLAERLITIVNTSHMKGIALDIEIPFSLNSQKPIQINNFVQQICTKLHADYKTCDLIVYGDSFFRSRPFDMGSLSMIVDRILVMAYDFHKSMGEPGPNFPLSKNPKREGGNIEYGYDFKQMISDFLHIVPKNKLAIIFGMYGYDWTLNDQGTPLKSAAAISVNAITTKIETLGKSTKSALSVTRNESLEPHIRYIDEEGRKHSIWYEDEVSVQKKIEYLKTKEIMQVSYWAQGYF